ncbi:hypothetical protein GCM10020000_13500 [Streptomyces olivoverticillatus]
MNLMLSPVTTAALANMGGLSPNARCKAFDAAADGIARGEGCGVVVLKPLSRALADGDHVWCTIRGSAANNDGSSNGLTAPSPVAQEEVLRAAYARAGVSPADVHFVEAHGTGTKLGDPIEAAALGAVFSPGRPADSPLRIGSVKTNMGHLEAAQRRRRTDQDDSRPAAPGAAGKPALPHPPIRTSRSGTGACACPPPWSHGPRTVRCWPV